MADLTKTLNTRLSLKIDTLENWNKSNIALLKGEIAIATVAASAGTGLTEPVCMIKIGEDGIKTFSQLDWNFYAKSSDVISACKSEDTLKTFVNNLITEADHATAEDLEKLAERVTAAEGDIETLNGDAETAGSVAKSIADAIAALKLDETYAAKEHEHVMADITDLQDALDDKVDKVEGKGLSTNDLTDDLKTNYDAAYDHSLVDHAPADAEKNIITTVKVNGEALTPDADRAVDVIIPEQTDYAVSIEEDTTDSTIAKRYIFKQLGSEIGRIDLAKDLVVTSGSVGEVTEADAPYAGAVVGDKYIELVIANQDEHIFIPAKDLVDIYTAQDDATEVQLSISGNNEISAILVDGGVAKSKLGSDVQESLGKADTALQASDLDDLNAKAHTHDNKELLDTYTQTEADLADAVAKNHAHENATVLDGISAEKVEAWDAAEQNAKDYADGLADNYATAEQGEKADSAVQTVSTPVGGDGSANGLKAVKSGTDVAISFDDSVTFIFDCGDAGVVTE